jgi:colanic acid/amylovoran biosynthesis protein
MLKIGLLWHASGAGNLGVGALTVGNLIAAREAAEAVGVVPRFTLIEFRKDLPVAYVVGQDIESYEINTRRLLSPNGYIRRIGALDCVLDIGAGDSFTDIYGPKRFAFLYLSKLMARLRGVPVLFSPQTIGPFSRQPYKTLAAQAMTSAYAVVARDPQSLEAARALAPAARSISSVDVAFRLPYEPPAHRRPDAPLEVGVNVSGLLFNGGYSGANEFGLQVDYAELVRGFISRMCARPNTRVHLICHVNSDVLPMDDDGRVADRLAAEFPSVVRAPDFASPSAAKSYIAGLDFLTAGRMHACIAAYSAGVPVIPVAYSRKFAGLFEGVLRYQWGIPARGMNTRKALDYLCDALDRRSEMKAAIAEGLVIARDAHEAYQDVLRELFRHAADRAAARRKKVGP